MRRQTQINGFRRNKIAMKMFTLLLVLVLTMPLTIVLTSDTAEAWKSDNHQELTQDALITLRNDGRGRIVDWMERLSVRDEYIHGARDADMFARYRDHYYCPETERGLGDLENHSGAFRSAREDFEIRLSRAQDYMKTDVEKAMYYLGWATHLLQDMYSPHHTQLEPLKGHSAFEDYASDNINMNYTHYGGYYDWPENVSEDPTMWIHDAAETGAEYYEYVVDNSTNDPTEEDLEYAWSQLQPKAIRQTAGFLDWFFETRPEFNLETRTVDKTGRTLDIRWAMDYHSNFTHYELYVEENSSALSEAIEEDEPYKTIESRGAGAYTISGLDYFTTYEVQVVAVREDEENVKGNVLSERTKWPYSNVITFVIIISMISLAFRAYTHTDHYDKIEKSVKKNVRK